MNGLLCVNKSSGITSRDVVNRIQRRLRPLKVGHAGTLDPLATGVLVVMVGKATRLTEYVQQMPKTYEGSFRFGEFSDTEDIDGAVSKLPDPPQPSLEEIENVLPRFVGEIEQMPPAYSALKVKGKRAYALARAGEKVDLKARAIEVYSVAITRYGYPDIDLSISCGSGTYIRSLGRDIARALGTEAIMTALTRSAIGSFSIASAIDSNILPDIDLNSKMLPMRDAVDTLAQITVSAADLERLRHGMCIAPDTMSAAFDENQRNRVEQFSEVAAMAPNGDLAAILVRRKSGWGPSKSFISG